MALLLITQSTSTPMMVLWPNLILRRSVEPMREDGADNHDIFPSHLWRVATNEPEIAWL